MWRLCLFSTILVLSSCTSEYEERLVEARHLRAKLESIQQNDPYMLKDEFSKEIKELKCQIMILAKVSGNETLFMREVYQD